ncbi:GntR family transcriptional regulator [Eisenbergiella sp.]
MNILLTNDSRLPIYEQLVRAIKQSILRGEAGPGDMLPSIRGLARDLDISVITTSRAYEELEKEGLIYSVQGKGFYVSRMDKKLLKETQLKDWEEAAGAWIDEGKRLGLSLEEILKAAELLYTR